MREYKIERKTAETDISLYLSLEESGESKIDTGCGFLDHMLTLFAKHSHYTLQIKCIGDTQVDYHHTAEDVGICLGEALCNCLGDKRGIVRYGDIILPMDESLILAAIDISGRGYLGYSVVVPSPKVGDFDTELVEEFFLALTRKAGITLHLRKLAGTNSHHIIEGTFKAFARALSAATKIDEEHKDSLPSTKGVL